MFPHEPAVVNAGLVPDPGHGNMPNGPLDTRCGDYGEPLPLQNLGILAQPYKGGNTRVPPFIRSAALALTAPYSRGGAPTLRIACAYCRASTLHEKYLLCALRLRSAKDAR
jgi:hypothetical protein